MLNDQKPDREKGKRRGIAAVKLVLILIAFILCILAVRNWKYSFLVVNQYIDSEVTYAGGETKYFENKNFGKINRGDVATVHVRLPEQPLMNNAVLGFYNFNATTEVWCGGTLLDSFGQDLAAKNMLIGNHKFFVNIPDQAWGSEITIVLRPTEDNTISDFNGALICPAQRVTDYYISSDPIGFVVAIALFVFGAAGLVACIFSRMRGRALLNSLCLVAFALLISFWIISNRMSYGLFGFSAYFWQPMEYIAGYTVAIPILLFYGGMADKRSKWHEVFFALAAIIAAVFAVATVLNFSNILHYNAFMTAFSALFIVSGILLCVYTFLRKSKNNSAETLQKIGMTVFVSTCILEIVFMASYQFPFMAFLRKMPALISLGALCLLLCLTGAYISDLYQKQKDAIAAQLKADALDRMIAATPAGICQIGTGEEMRILSANDLFYEILRTPKHETPQGGKGELLQGMSEETRAKIRLLREGLLSGAAPTGSMEFTFHTAQNAERTILARYHYDKANSGNVIAAILDITDRKHMEDELRISEERYRLALTQSGKLFFFFDVPSRTMRLSDKLAAAFGLPNEVDNMPENFISQGLVEPKSVEGYRRFYERIIAGEPSGDAIISCHMRDEPDDVLWYRITFTSVFDASGAPQSAIITYDDLQEQHDREVAGTWKQLNLVSIPSNEYCVFEYNLTQNRLLKQSGGLFAKTPDNMTGYEEINAFVLAHFIDEGDREAYERFLDRSRLLDQFQRGETEAVTEYRSLQSGSAYRWTSTSLQMIRDCYSGDVLCQLFIHDIDQEKTGQLKLRQDVKDLTKELENSRIRIMINQMRPHFLYNALSAIQTIVKYDPDYACKLIYDFTIHLRSSIKALSSDAPIPFRDELKNIKAYLNIEQMRFGKSLQVNYDIQCDDFMVIPLSIQPLAENAARHGVYPKGDEGGTVTVRTRQTQNAYVVEVEDDGMGFDVNEALTKNGDSIGLKKLVFRLKSLMNAEVSIQSTPGVGTKATVTIPKAEGAASLPAAPPALP